MCSYVLTLASKVSRDRRVVTRGSGRAKGEVNGNMSGEPGSGMKRIAPGLCSRFLARRRTCSHISNRVLSSPLRYGPLLTLPSANSLTYAGTYVYPCTIFRMNTNASCPCGQTHPGIVRYDHFRYRERSFQSGRQIYHLNSPLHLLQIVINISVHDHKKLIHEFHVMKIYDRIYNHFILAKIFGISIYL